MSRFVGRSEEFATLATALNGALEGHGRVVGVAGEAGVGKTRLCLELVQHCRDRGVTVLEAHCPAHGESVPLLPIRQLLRAAFGVSDGDGAESSRKQIAGELLALGGVFQEMLPLVFEFLEVPDPDLPPPALDSEWRQARLFNFIRRFVQARSAAEPTVLLIDDLHWIDSQSNAFLAEMVEALGWTRTFLLVNFRPQHHAEWMDASYYQQLDLSPLRGEAVHALLGDLLGHDPQTADLRELISERTQGNPFFIEEVVQSLFDHGALVRDEAPKRRHGGTRSRRASGAIAVSGGVRLTRPVTEIDIPATVQVLLAARIDRLPEREKLVLQTAAVIGKTFARDVLARVLSTQPDPDASSTPWCAVNDAELTESLDRLEAADFIRPDPVRPDADFTFKHPLTQAVAYGSQLTEARMRLHATVARAIEELHTDELGQKAALLAHHWEAAQMRFEAARWRRRAALRVTNIQLRGRRQRPQ